MTLKRKMMIVLFISTFVAVCSIFLVLQTLISMKHGFEHLELADSIARSTFELSRLTRECIHNYSEPSKKEWQSVALKTKELISIFQARFDAGHQLIQAINNDFDELDAYVEDVWRELEKKNEYLESKEIIGIQGQYSNKIFTILTEINRHSLQFQKLHEDQLKKQVNRVMIVATVALLTIIFIVFFLVISTGSFMLNSLNRLKTVINSVKNDHLLQIIETHRKDEIGELEQAFNSMMARLHETMSSRDELDREVRIRQQAQIELEMRNRELKCLTEVFKIISNPNLDITNLTQSIEPVLNRYLPENNQVQVVIQLNDSEMLSAQQEDSNEIVRYDLGGNNLGFLEFNHQQNSSLEEHSWEFKLLKSTAEVLKLFINQYMIFSDTNRRFQVMLNIAPLPVAFVDFDGNIKFISQRFTELFGYELKEINHVDLWFEKAYPDPEYRGYVIDIWNKDVDSARKNNSDIVPRDYNVFCKNGVVKCVEFSGTSILNDCLVVCYDRTKERNLLSKQKQLTQKLARSNKELEQFAYVASHDLQEPLRTVASYVQLFTKKYGENIDEKGERWVGYIVSSVTRMQSLINDLLLFSRIDRKGRPLVPVKVETVIDEVVDSLETLIRETSTRIVKSIEFPEVLADEKQLFQVLQNLINNAIKFAHPDRTPVVKISAKLVSIQDIETMSQNNSQTMCRFEVSDNGIGFDEQYKTRIFTIFQRLHSRDEYPGTGMGLAICKSIIERHGGDIDVSSVKGKGSTFHFTLNTPDRVSK